jgi:hypothetical protein
VATEPGSGRVTLPFATARYVSLVSGQDRQLALAV